jgi:hypothetical protein
MVLSTGWPNRFAVNRNDWWLQVESARQADLKNISIPVGLPGLTGFDEAGQQVQSNVKINPN